MYERPATHCHWAVIGAVINARVAPLIDSYMASDDVVGPYMRTHRYHVPAVGMFAPNVAVPAGAVAEPVPVPAGVSM